MNATTTRRRTRITLAAAGLATAALALTACNGSTDSSSAPKKSASEEVAPAAKAAPAEEKTEAKPVTLSGHGTNKTKKVDLNGDYKVKITWSGNTLGGTESNMILTLQGDDFDMNQLVNNISASGSTTTHAYDLDGAYYIDAMADGDWTATFTPA
ncbi:hypothetical protein ACWD2L_00570 [Streptomyces sp. NPDC002754]